MPAIAVENIRKMKIMKFSAKKLTQNFDPSSLSKKIRKCVHSSLNVFNQTVFKLLVSFRKNARLASSKFFTIASETLVGAISIFVGATPWGTRKRFQCFLGF